MLVESLVMATSVGKPSSAIGPASLSRNHTSRPSLRVGLHRSPVENVTMEITRSSSGMPWGSSSEMERSTPFVVDEHCAALVDSDASGLVSTIVIDPVDGNRQLASRTEVLAQEEADRRGAGNCSDRS